MLKLVQYLPDGAQRIVRLIRTSDVAGLESMVGKAYEHDAIVLQPTEICCLPVDTVRMLGKENPDLHVELLRRWQHALSEADAWLTELSTGPARERVARLLLRLVRDEEHPECTLFGREDLGAMLGITTETASRTIAEFKRQGLLNDLGGNRYRVDMEKVDALLAD
jgi:CRP-like cAMP-binding protein